MTDTNAADGRAEDEQPEDGDLGRSNIDRRRTRARSSPSPTYLNRRKELIDAAARVMSRKGVKETTLGDIATEAGTDRASIYYYVKGKEELLAEMLRSALTANVEIFREIVSGPGSASVKLRRIVHRWMASYDAHFPYLYVWVYEDPSRLQGIDSAVLDEMVDLSQQGYELVRDVITEGVRSGEFQSALPVGVLAQSAIGLVAWTYRWYEPNHELTAREVADGLADLLLRGLDAPGANLSTRDIGESQYSADGHPGRELPGRGRRGGQARPPHRGVTPARRRERRSSIHGVPLNSSQQLPGDHHALDVRRALAQPLDAQVAEPALQRQLL